MKIINKIKGIVTIAASILKKLTTSSLELVLLISNPGSVKLIDIDSKLHITHKNVIKGTI